ncbi:MAG: hypothetical protein LBD65_01265 [Spirochaetaceae bacterium]|nr:hypothetical protein [Spirochaetaceae bacterium]
MDSYNAGRRGMSPAKPAAFSPIRQGMKGIFLLEEMDAVTRPNEQDNYRRLTIFPMNSIV